MPRRVVPICSLPEPRLARVVEQHVVRHDQVRVGADPQAREVDALGAQAVELAGQHLRVDHDAVADRAQLARVEDPRRDQVELPLHAVADDGVAGVVAALEADDEVRAARRAGRRPCPCPRRPTGRPRSRCRPCREFESTARRPRAPVAAARLAVRRRSSSRQRPRAGVGAGAPAARIVATRWSSPNSGSGSPHISYSRDTVRSPICVAQRRSRRRGSWSAAPPARPRSAC